MSDKQFTFVSVKSYRKNLGPFWLFAPPAENPLKCPECYCEWVMNNSVKGWSEILRNIQTFKGRNIQHFV